MRDFGVGLGVDELIGMTAWHITHLTLPPGRVFEAVVDAAQKLIAIELESAFLVELWEDGHSVWVRSQDNQPVVVSANGQIQRTQR
jgi:hypothetical protein